MIRSAVPSAVARRRSRRGDPEPAPDFPPLDGFGASPLAMTPGGQNLWPLV